MLPSFGSSRERTSGPRRPMDYQKGTSGQTSRGHGLARGGPQRPVEAAVRRRRSHDPVLGSPSDLPGRQHDNPEPVADNKVEYSTHPGTEPNERN